MLYNCVNIKAKKFNFFKNFVVQQRNNNLLFDALASLEASYNIEEDILLIVRNNIVVL